MKRILLTSLVGLFFMATLLTAQEPVSENPISNLNELDHFLTENFSLVEKSFRPGDQNGQWRFQAGGREVVVVADQNHDRIRAMSSVGEIDPRDSKMLFKLLEANFGRALDARYAITRNVLWSLFLHPLKDCRPTQLEDGIKQVVTLAENTGSTYASSELVFGEE